jgi:hypothetical protein
VNPEKLTELDFETENIEAGISFVEKTHSKKTTEKDTFLSTILIFSLPQKLVSL